MALCTLKYCQAAAGGPAAQHGEDRAVNLPQKAPEVKDLGAAGKGLTDCTPSPALTCIPNL